MGEQVLYLPSSNSAEQSCHQTLKGAIKAAAQPISGHCFGAFLLPKSLSKVLGPAWLCVVLPALGAGVLLLLGTAGALWDTSWLPAFSGGKSVGSWASAGVLPQQWGVGFTPGFEGQCGNGAT